MRDEFDEFDEFENTAEEEKDLQKAWYIITTYSGNEQRAAENIKKRQKLPALAESISQVLVCEKEEPVFDENGIQKVEEGKPVFKTVNQTPGYIFVEMIMTNDAWYLVRNTPGVTGIAGSSGGGQKPTPVSREDIEPVLKRMGKVDDTMYDRYNIGDEVKVIHGALEGTEGRITFIDKETGHCRVDTVFFGRVTPVDVDFSDIEKM